MKYRKEKVTLLIYGEGGHKSEMKRLLTSIENNCNSNKYISIYENGAFLNEDTIQKNYEFPTMRDKYSKIKTILNIITGLFKIISLLFHIKRKYDVKIILSTGPGLTILPAYFFKIFQVKLIYIETDCRFTTKSFTGKLLYPISDKFYVPNQSLLKLYPKSEYCGRL
ncbi:MAG: hypothetical protein L3J43_10575 [Sulfurovum sp.]|nr:hypothetical protein [Sulfurovum sp.]